MAEVKQIPISTISIIDGDVINSITTYRDPSFGLVHLGKIQEEKVVIDGQDADQGDLIFIQDDGTALQVNFQLDITGELIVGGRNEEEIAKYSINELGELTYQKI